MELADRSAITRGGWAVAVLGALAYLFGWLLGWVELLVIAASAMLVLLIAIGFVVGRLRFEMVRTIEPQRVTVGDAAVGSLTVINPGKAPTGPVTADDHIGEQVVPIEIPPLGPGESTESLYHLPTDRRGVLDVGPVVISKTDPLGLMRRQIEHAKPRRLWVRPKTVALSPLPTGFAKDLEGPTSDTSPKGDVAFHALREYVFGDDYRHIHWKSSARIGSLMVRQYVDNRRPHLTIVLDIDPASYDADLFELAVSSSASLCGASLFHGQPLSMYSGVDAVIGQNHRASADEVLDYHAGVKLTDGSYDLERAILMAVRAEGGTSAVAVVTGRRPAKEVARLGTTLRRHARGIVLRCIEPEDQLLPDVAGVSVINVTSLEALRAGWTRIAR